MALVYLRGLIYSLCQGHVHVLVLTLKEFFFVSHVSFIDSVICSGYSFILHLWHSGSLWLRIFVVVACPLMVFHCSLVLRFEYSVG